jgi:hypothetical protein
VERGEKKSAEKREKQKTTTVPDEKEVLRTDV